MLSDADLEALIGDKLYAAVETWELRDLVVSSSSKDAGKVLTSTVALMLLEEATTLSPLRMSASLLAAAISSLRSPVRSSLQCSCRKVAAASPRLSRCQWRWPCLSCLGGQGFCWPFRIWWTLTVSVLSDLTS